MRWLSCKENWLLERNNVRGNTADLPTQEFFAGGFTPGIPPNLQMNETHILIRLLRMYIPRKWEFGSALAKLRNFGGGTPLL
jgi:hypothetical protein